MSHVKQPTPELSVTSDHNPAEIAAVILQEAIVILNEMRPDLSLLDPAADHTFLGDGAVFDSMGLVTYLNLVEGLLHSKLGINIEVISEKAMSMKSSPFQSTTSLNAYLTQELRKEGE